MSTTSLLLTVLVTLTLTTAFPIAFPPWLSIHAPSPFDAAFMTAGKSVRDTFPPSGADFNTYCTSRNDIVMNASTLPPVSPGLTLYHVALGRGTQNYTCPTSDPTAAPQALGAAAILFNVTCLQSPVHQVPVFDRLFAAIAAAPIPPEGNPNESGHHYFTNGNVTATFNLNTPYITGDLGITFSGKVANISAPANALKGSDGSAAVPWLKLANIGPAPKPVLPGTVDIDVADQHADVKEIYRINTAGGAAPKTCANNVGQTFEVQYAAEYWFWH